MSKKRNTKATSRLRPASAKQRKAMLRKARQERLRKEQKRKRRNFYLAGAGIATAVAAILIIAALGLLPGSKDPYAGLAISEICYPAEPHAYDVHVQLDIEITEDDGSVNPVPIRNKFGEQNDCVHVIHTHDASGELHVHMEKYRRVTLGDFFEIWDQPFNATTLFEKTVDENHELNVTINGKANTDYEELELRPNQEIEIKFRPLN